MPFDRYYTDRPPLFEPSSRQPATPPSSGSINGKSMGENRVTKQLYLRRYSDKQGAPPASALSYEKADVPQEAPAAWALVNRSVTDMRRKPNNLYELVNQALLGDAVQIQEVKGEWVYARLEHDGYLGWMHAAALQRCFQPQVRAYQEARNARVIAELLPAWLAPEPASGAASGNHLQAGKLPFGTRLVVENWLDDVAQVRLPDNRLWWVESQGLLPYDRCPKPDAEGIDFTLRLMQRFIGVPYHWGGRTPFGFDCSGLSQTFLSFLGVSAPRDASQQFLAGVPVEGARQPGDLLFFGETLKNKRVKVTHVAISLGGDEIIHANGVTWNTAYNSLDPQSPIYRGWLRSTLVGVRRFV